MTEPEPNALHPAVAAYIAERDRPPQPPDPARARISERYARFYAPFAIWSVTLAFFPLFDASDRGENVVSRWGSVFDMAARANGDPAVFGLILLGILVVLLVVASFRARSPFLPASIGLLAGMIALMLVTKPGTGSRDPDLSASGMAGLVLSLAMMLLAWIHAIQLMRSPR